MFKKYFLPLIVFCSISLTTLTLIITRMSPCREYGNSSICSEILPINHIFLYLSIAIFLGSLFSIITFWLRQRSSQSENLDHYFNTSLRQGVLFSLFSTTCVFFLSLGILKWWTSLLLLVLVILTEFLSLQRKPFS